MSSYDVMIVGGGIVGATAALALSQTTSLKVALVDSRSLISDWKLGGYENRVSAISLASSRLFKRLQVWELINAKRISPYTKMHVWEESGSSRLEFDCGDIRESALGYIIEDAVIRSSLLQRLEQDKKVVCLSEVKPVELKEHSHGYELVLDDGNSLQAALLIAADGGNSWVREQANIPLATKHYAHNALVTTVKTELSHDAVARQRFLTSGPLAFLPLSDPHHCSIVWSAAPARITELLALGDDEFCDQLSQAFECKLGKVLSADKRMQFPLQMRHAKQYVKSRLALIGDAAHTVHPLAGQGVNLGLHDVTILVNVITTAIAKKRDYTSFATLRRYERTCKTQNLSMLTFVEGIQHLFGSEIKPVKSIRSLGLSVVNQIPMIKNFFANYAVGNNKLF